MTFYSNNPADPGATQGGLHPRVRHLVVAALLVFAASQTLAQQHVHAADDVTACVICAHGDHSPITSTIRAKTAAVVHQISWSSGLHQSLQLQTSWPDFQSRAPPAH
ncbi:MAG: hypothetical protein ACFHXK_02575 [bacterium]